MWRNGGSRSSNSSTHTEWLSMIVYTDKFLLSRARKRAKLAEARWLCIAYKNMVCIHIRYRHETKRNEKKIHKNNIHLHLLTATEHNTRNNNNNGRRICGEREQKLVFRHHVIFVQYFCQALIRSHSNSISLVLRCASSVSVSYFFLYKRYLRFLFYYLYR